MTGSADASTGASSSTGTSSSTGSSSSTGAETSGSGGTSGPTDAAACPAVYDPVCGRDGETYDNACVVPEGVGIRREGPCLGDCEGSCTVVGSPQISLMLSLFVLLLLRRRG